MKPLFVQWGGGNIGRSFIAQVFFRAGFRVAIIDINQTLVEALNHTGSYTIESVFGSETSTLVVDDVYAILASDQKAVNEAIAQASFLGISVGRGAWPHIVKALAESISYRYSLSPANPLDIILAENIHGCSHFSRSLLRQHLGPSFPLESYLGFAETSIGKMVPIQDPAKLLLVRSEPYNELIVDAKAFHHPLPDFQDFHPVHPIGAYVDRKLFIHNMGHSATAYLGYLRYPERTTIAEVITDSNIREEVEKAMHESRDVLLALHDGVFTKEGLDDHIRDLLNRFSNPALGDTVHRVGRDLRRKLRYDDRILGIIVEAEKLGMPWQRIGRIYLKALLFKACDQEGKPYAQDVSFLESLENLSWKEKFRVSSSWDESNLSNDLFASIASKLEHLS